MSRVTEVCTAPCPERFFCSAFLALRGDIIIEELDEEKLDLAMSRIELLAKAAENWPDIRTRRFDLGVAIISHSLLASLKNRDQMRAVSKRIIAAVGGIERKARADVAAALYILLCTLSASFLSEIDEEGFQAILKLAHVPKDPYELFTYI